MLEEFRFLKVSFEGTLTWRNERFKNFINIIFGTAALLAVIAQLSRTSSVLSYSIIVISAILYLYGLFVFSRLVAGYFTIERYRRAINKVRKYFVDLDKDLEGYLVVPVDSPEPTDSRIRLGSGLLGTTVFTNSLLLLVSGATLFLEVVRLQVLPSVGLGLLLALLSWGLHAAYYSRRVKKNARKR